MTLATHSEPLLAWVGTGIIIALAVAVWFWSTKDLDSW